MLGTLDYVLAITRTGEPESRPLPAHAKSRTKKPTCVGFCEDCNLLLVQRQNKFNQLFDDILFLAGWIESWHGRITPHTATTLGYFSNELGFSSGITFVLFRNVHPSWANQLFVNGVTSGAGVLLGQIRHVGCHCTSSYYQSCCCYAYENRFHDFSVGLFKATFKFPPLFRILYLSGFNHNVPQRKRTAPEH